MAESTQLQKKLKMIPSAEENKDYLSHLPDDIICHILSFLSTREACRTSILSTRWRSLWTMVPALYFFSPSKSESEEKKELFVPSINTVLSRRTGQIRKLRLSCDGSCEPHHVQALISTAIVCNVEQMVLNIYLPNITQLPPSLFTCKSLVALKLQFHICPDFPSFVYLPSLKNFHMSLTCSQEIRDDSLTTFLSGCPVLEDLNLAGSLPLRIKISVPTLKELKLRTSPKTLQGVHELEINAPSLEVLDLSDKYLEEYMIVNLQNVARANLSLCSHQMFIEDSFKLFQGLSNVKSMSLTYLTTNYLCDGGIFDYNPYLPEFYNLVHLRVEITDEEFYWDLLGSFLQKAHTLEVCVIGRNFKKKSTRRVNANLSWLESSNWHENSCCPWWWYSEWSGPPNVPVCLSSSLKRFEFRGLQNIKGELDFVQYIVKNSSVLEKVTIFAIPSEVEVLQSKLSEIQKGSRSLWDIQFKE